MSDDKRKTPPDRLKGSIVWFALGMIVVGVTGTIVFLAWLKSEVEDRVGDELRKPETIESVTSNPTFMAPLVGRNS